jgi:hypothetical protein
MNFIDLCKSTNIINELLLLLTIDDLLSLKLTCKELCNVINVPLQTIREIRFYTTDNNLVTYDNMLRYMNDNNIRTYTYTIRCKFNNIIDIESLKILFFFLENIELKNDNKKKFLNCVELYITHPTKLHYKIFKNGAIQTTNAKTITDFYDSLNVLTNILKTSIDNNFKIIPNSIKACSIFGIFDLGFNVKNINEAINLIIKEFNAEIQRGEFKVSKSRRLLDTRVIIIKQKTNMTCRIFLSGKVQFITNNYTHIYLLHLRLKKCLEPVFKK